MGCEKSYTALHAMARAEHQAQSAIVSGQGDPLSDDSDDSDSGYDSDSSGDVDDSEESSGEEEEEDAEAIAAAAKKKRVRADIGEMRRMMDDMGAIKVRLQQRFAAERQARAERHAREDRERELQDAARRKAQEEASRRQVEACVQTDAELVVAQQQMHVSQRNMHPPDHPDGAGGAALPAVDGGTGFADAAANKPKPARLRLYDLVKASGFGLSPKARSPVRQVDPPELLPTHCSNEYERVSPGRRQPLPGEQQDPAVVRGWSGGGDSQFDLFEDSVVGVDDESDIDGYSASHHGAGLDSVRSNPRHPKGEHSLAPSRHYDENSASVSNSLVSSDTGNRPALFPDLIQRRGHKFNAAALLSTDKHPPLSTTNDGDGGKTDEQREMEAIQFLLFGRSARR